ncbi:hypothetical protein CSV79_02245 [Sporosarcina sp. P13]|uniref:DUF1292 domain-containing protein n=1 Tax=Sporosarcina sp. P13 TaxID=2048263 RepID=UPI000C167D3F|nr:DUF1292 domain-containing protein [Sporosarcina sp. P13]PIC65463.1 hypothetical protein CSV79_02245 [Sporosarcina sp. P13]
MEHGQETMTIIDENGEEHVCEVILTFDSKEYERSYVLYHVLDGEQVDDDEDVEIHAAAFIPTEEGQDGGSLLEIESDEEWDMIEEVLNTFLEEEEE